MRDEERDAADPAGERRQRVEHRAQGEEDGVGALPADVVGERCPADPPGDVEHAEQRREGRADGGELRLLSLGEVLERHPGKPMSRPPNTSWIIGEAMPMTPIPALTLRHSTPHRNQNCGVLQAWSTCTWPRGDHAAPQRRVLGREGPMARTGVRWSSPAGGTR